MNFSAGVRNVLLAGFLAVTNGETHADSAAEKVRHQLDVALESARGRGKANHSLRHRQLQVVNPLHTDFSMFVGKWYDCMHTTLMTFNGHPDRHMAEEKACSMKKFGTVSKIGKSSQMLRFDIMLLNSCDLHDLGGKGQEPCPNDGFGKGNVFVKYSFKGIGSFAVEKKIEFSSDHTYMRDKKGEWVPLQNKAKIENRDTLICQEYMEGIVCDWKINEYRTKKKAIEMGCQMKGKKGSPGKCVDIFDEQECKKKKGTWTEDCAEMESIPNSFVYDSFASYYLVKDAKKCDPAMFCPTVK